MYLEFRHVRPGMWDLVTPLKITWLKCDCSSHYKRKLQLSSNSLKIGISSVTLRVPRIMEGLDAPDGRHYSWLYCDWPPKESIGRTNLFVDCSCIEWNFWKDDLANQLFWSVSKTWFLTLVLQNILCFLLPFFFFLMCSLKVGVHIIQRRALYTGKYGIWTIRPGRLAPESTNLTMFLLFVFYQGFLQTIQYYMFFLFTSYKRFSAVLKLKCLISKWRRRRG